MSQPLILIIEDHNDIVEILRYNLSREGYELAVANDGLQGLKQVANKRPDLILLDIMLPGLDGIEVCRRLKSDTKTKTIPVIMLTAKGEESDVVLGLGLGADDYVAKPFSPKELLARIKAVLRRTTTAESSISTDVAQPLISVHGLTIDSVRHMATLDKQALTLTLAEFKLLRTLASNPGRVLNREKLLEKMCGPDVNVVDRNIDVHIASLRRKLKNAGDLIETVRGVGYRFKE